MAPPWRPRHTSFSEVSCLRPELSSWIINACIMRSTSLARKLAGFQSHFLKHQQDTESSRPI